LSDENKTDHQPEPKEKSPANDFIQVSLPDKNTCPLELVLTSGNTLCIGSDVDSRILNNVLSALKQAKLC